MVEDKRNRRRAVNADGGPQARHQRTLPTACQAFYPPLCSPIGLSNDVGGME